MVEYSFKVTATDGQARLGHIVTAHGKIDTPAFMPVGTAATVKAMLPQSVAQTGAQIVLGNTYHLMLRPGAERVARLGGLHHFMDWSGPILTDSGGFQAMSLSGLNRIDETGIDFKSHIDGQPVQLTPESSVDIQRLLDADVTMVLDECTAFPATKAQAAESMRRSMRWAARCREAFCERPGYALFGIVQGGVYPDLRQESATALQKVGFDGYAVGGLAVGEGQPTMLRMLEATVPHLPDTRPRYLMGVGKPDDLVLAVARGVDMFDCVLPTRSGRNGQAFTPTGALNLRNARHKDDPRPLQEGCGCPACRQFSRAYLHHLVRAKEILGAMLLTWHNLHYYQQLMADMRAAIAVGRLVEFTTDFFAKRAEK